MRIAPDGREDRLTNQRLLATPAVGSSEVLDAHVQNAAIVELLYHAPVGAVANQIQRFDES